MKTEFITYYENACQDPRCAVVARHRSRLSAERFVRRCNRSINNDGYSHRYCAAELRGLVNVKIGDDAMSFDIIFEYYERQDRWVAVGYDDF